MSNPFEYTGMEELPFVDEEVEGLEELNPELTECLSKLAIKAVERLEREVVNPAISRRDDVRRALPVSRRQTSGHNFASVLAVDSTWSSPPLELVWGSMAVIVVGYVVATPDTGFHGISYASLYHFPEARGGKSIELRSKVLEYATAIKVLRKFGGVVDAVLIDGPLAPSFTLSSFFNPASVSEFVSESRKVSGSKLASYVSKALIELARACREAGLPLVGVVKRVGSKFLVPLLEREGLSEVARAARLSNDKAIVSLVLEPGEYVDLGDAASLMESYLDRFGYRKALKALHRACDGSLGPLAKELCDVLRDTRVVFYRAPRDVVYPQATRIDVYPSSALGKVLDYVMEESSQNSVPIAIDLVDRFVRLESSSIRKFHEMLLSRATKSETIALLGLTNPQKAYLVKREVTS